uniref:Uncharacterized protein n=1 Tax=Octopus bimaculoides TaxID=37653 RepID=A0A0L8HL45_OCTBM
MIDKEPVKYWSTFVIIVVFIFLFNHFFLSMWKTLAGVTHVERKAPPRFQMSSSHSTSYVVWLTTFDFKHSHRGQIF